MINALSVDVEDYFHPTEFQSSLGVQGWDQIPSRVTESTKRILDILGANGVRCTCFTLGWVARKHPGLVRLIAEAGHEIACHSHLHRLVYDLSPKTFREDTMEAVRALADASGVRPVAYRSPSYSITERSLWALEVLVECGFRYDSSIYPIRHDRYGIATFPRHAVSVNTPSGRIVEIPVATVKLPGGRVAPIGGGAYMRLFPYRYTAAGIRWRNEVENEPACIYLHPWEVDPGQPRLIQGRIGRFRTYSGLDTMAGKLERLTKGFQFSTITDVYPWSQITRSWEQASWPPLGNPIET